MKRATRTIDPRIAINGRYLDEVQIVAGPNQVQSYPASRHTAHFDDQQNLVLGVQAQTLVQLCFDGVFSNDRAVPIDVQVGATSHGPYILDGIALGKRTAVDDVIDLTLRPHAPGTAATAAFAALRTSWRIVETEVWDPDALDLIQPAFIRFDETSRFGELGLVAMGGGLDCRYSYRDGRPFVEFSWSGDDDGRAKSGRGYATIEPDARLHGRFYLHHGDDSDFVAERSLERLRGVPPVASPRPRRARRPR